MIGEMSNVQYLGHGPSGGVQQHSMGKLYPYTVMAQGKPASLKWAAMDLRTGRTGMLRGTYKEAEIDAASLLIRNMMHN